MQGGGTPGVFSQNVVNAGVVRKRVKNCGKERRENRAERRRDAGGTKSESVFW
jgi:hypothetical protein